MATREQELDSTTALFSLALQRRCLVIQKDLNDLARALARGEKERENQRKKKKVTRYTFQSR